MDFPDHPFWNYSLAVHRVPGVHEACVALQAQYGLDVNLLFFCCWAGGGKGVRLDDGQVRQAVDAVLEWQNEIVRPIWKARRRLKPSFGRFPADRTEALRRALIEAELDAEHIEQLHLGDSVPLEGDPNLPAEIRLGYAVDNLFSCLDLLFQSKAGPTTDRRSLAGPLTSLISACFPETGRERLLELIACRC